MSADDGLTIEFKNLIIATGSRPVEIPGFKFEGRVVDSTGGLNLPEIPKEFVVIGGGYVGTELAGAYANLGSHVTILEGTPSILPNFDKDMVSVVLKQMKKKGIDVVTSAMQRKPFKMIPASLLPTKLTVRKQLLRPTTAWLLSAGNQTRMTLVLK